MYCICRSLFYLKHVDLIGVESQWFKGSMHSDRTNFFKANVNIPTDSKRIQNVMNNKINPSIKSDIWVLAKIKSHEVEQLVFKRLVMLP